MLAASTSATTEDSSTFSATVMVPVTLAKRPLTLLTIMWRTTKPTSECEGSIVQVPVVRPGRVVTVLVLMSLLWLVGVCGPWDRGPGRFLLNYRSPRWLNFQP